MPVDAARLAAVPAFADLPEDERARIAAASEVVEVPEGKALTKEGDYGFAFFVVDDGTAVVTDDGQQLAELGPGDFFGEIGLLLTERRTATVTATSPMRLMMLFDRDFRRVCAEVPAFERILRDAMSERFGAKH